jgi:hypothetical protein
VKLHEFWLSNDPTFAKYNDMSNCRTWGQPCHGIENMSFNGGALM